MKSSRWVAVLAGLTVGLALAGCAGEDDEAPPTGGGEDAAEVGHVHGLGVDPADGSLYVATHFGLFHVEESGDASRVADRWQDTMAFTVVGPGHFLASGHPDLREDLPPHLGLIESTDAGETWEPLALQGEADFHILEQVGGVLYAYDSTTGRLLSTRDRRAFEEVLRAPLLSVTADPASEDRLLATTADGQLIGIDVTSGSTTTVDGPATVLVDTTPDGAFAGIGPDGAVRVSTGAREWRVAGMLDGPPAAFTITEQGWFAATETGVYRSIDDGRSWDQVL